jgi:urea transporter
VPLGFALESTLHGVGQVMFHASVWTGILFLAGIAISNRVHASWVLVGSAIGMLLAAYNVDAAWRSIDPERLIERTQFENIRLGLFGYNATLAAVALWLWRPSLVYPLVGIISAMVLTSVVPLFGLPALTAPFVLATWLVMLIAKLETGILSPSDGPTAA